MQTHMQFVKSGVFQWGLTMQLAICKDEILDHSNGYNDTVDPAGKANALYMVRSMRYEVTIYSLLSFDAGMSF